MKEDIEKIKDLKAVYSGAIEAGELSIANIIKSGIDLIEKLQKENEELKNRWDKDTHKLQNDLDIANAERIELKEENEGLKYKYDKALSDLVKAEKETIPTQKIKDILNEINKEYIKQEKIFNKHFEKENRDIQDYYIQKEAINIMQELSWIEGKLQDLLEEKGK